MIWRFGIKSVTRDRVARLQRMGTVGGMVQMMTCHPLTVLAVDRDFVWEYVVA